MGRSNLRNDYSLCPLLEVDSGQTEFVTSKPIPTSAATAHSLSIFFKATDVILGGGEEILVKMQHEVAMDCWLDIGVVATVHLTVDGRYAIRLDRGVPVEALVLPLGQPVRLVTTTGASSSAKISEVNAMIGE